MAVGCEQAHEAFILKRGDNKQRSELYSIIEAGKRNREHWGKTGAAIFNRRVRKDSPRR